ncbi:hypothetical protein [Mesorhizobium sp.]|uniref:hypothetical protein n=1 Tax=Mesorhizobium sp. TaxID=1871066 RepID=UPI00120B86C0|nr:hypothetical protein [Mesorhizobium sp.]TIM05519.1 MAG: hypothetical protein E5Y62_27410 [Mesorhizobium sp.]
MLESKDILRFAVTSLHWAAGLVPVPQEWRDVVKAPAMRPSIGAVEIVWSSRWEPCFELTLTPSRIS